MTRTDEAPDPRDEIEMLLPWYVTGRLDPEDHRRVEAALAADATLRARVALIREERAETVAANQAISVPRAVSAARIVASAGASPTRRLQATLSGFIDNVRGFFDAPSGRSVRWATAIAAAVVLAQAAAIGTLLRDRGDAGYETASGPGGAITGAGTLAMVRFADDATAASISATLGRLSMAIVDGPKPGNLYRVRLGDGAMSEKDRAMAIERLMAEGRVVVFVSTATPAR